MRVLVIFIVVIIVFMVIITLLLLMPIQQSDSVGAARNDKVKDFVAFFRLAFPVPIAWPSLTA